MTGFLSVLTSMTLNDLEPPKKGFLVNFSQFWMQHTFQHWIVTIWLKIDQDNPHKKFSALNVDFSSPIPDPLGSRRPAQASIEDNYPSKKWLFCHNYLV